VIKWFFVTIRTDRLQSLINYCGHIIGQPYSQCMRRIHTSI